MNSFEGGVSYITLVRGFREEGRHPTSQCPLWVKNGRFTLVLRMPGIKAAPISSACECAHIITPRLDSRVKASIQILQMRKLFNAGFHLDVAPIEARRTLQCEQAAKLKYG